MSERAKINLPKFIEYLTECGELPFLYDGQDHMAVCHGCGEVVFPGFNCGGDARETPSCKRVPQPMTYGHIADLLAELEAEIQQMKAAKKQREEAAIQRVTDGIFPRGCHE